jgi:hypothetical protein
MIGRNGGGDCQRRESRTLFERDASDQLVGVHMTVWSGGLP